MNIEIIYEDKNFLAVNKPSGVLVHAISRGSNENTLVGFLLSKYPEIKNVGDAPDIRPGIVHRLDKDTSGVMAVAKNQKYFEYLKDLFQKRKVKKTYVVLVRGRVEPRDGIISKPIGLKSGTTKRTVFTENAKMVKSAETGYKLKKYLNVGGEDYSLLEVMPKTGRTHQIRVHLASIGHPIAGDKIYGKKVNPPGLNRLFLHAESLEFPKAEGERIKISAELPQELQELVDKNS
ncbi:MAG: RluA family pseudouridine synthase [Candidatus Colwellbacteria bacterium]|nr:RluA family pseudouridine synthase [Candidatus Colwellbacteria bacterium]